MVKQGDYFRVVLSGGYCLSFGCGDRTETRRLKPGAMLLNRDGSWHREQGDEDFVVFVVSVRPEAAQYFLKRRSPAGGRFTP